MGQKDRSGGRKRRRSPRGLQGKQKNCRETTAELYKREEKKGGEGKLFTHTRE